MDSLAVLQGQVSPAPCCTLIEEGFSPSHSCPSQISILITSHDSEQTASFLSLWCKLKESDRLTQAQAAKRWKRRSSLRSSKYRSRKSFSTLCRLFSCEAEFRWTFATLPKCHRETSHCLFKHDQALSETNSHSI